jgi:hypothetical protein
MSKPTPLKWKRLRWKHRASSCRPCGVSGSQERTTDKAQGSSQINAPACGELQFSSAAGGGLDVSRRNPQLDWRFRPT